MFTKIVYLNVRSICASWFNINNINTSTHVFNLPVFIQHLSWAVGSEVTFTRFETVWNKRQHQKPLIDDYYDDLLWSITMVLVVTINWELDFGQLNLSDFIISVGFSMSVVFTFSGLQRLPGIQKHCFNMQTSSLTQDLLTLMMSNIQYGWMIMERVDIHSRVHGQAMRSKRSSSAGIKTV